MACEDIALHLKDLRMQRAELKKSLELALNPRVRESLEEKLNELQLQIDREEQKLADCKAIAEQENNPTPRAFTGRVERIVCSEARQRESGKHEPYLLITTVDLTKLEVDSLGIRVIVPIFHCSLIGPLSDVKPPYSYYPSDELPAIRNPKFWNLNGLPKSIDSPEQVVFVVGLFENDSSSPEFIRGAMNGLFQATRLPSLHFDHTTFANTLVNDTIAIFDIARLFGVTTLGFPDDRIGVRHLALTKSDLDTINALGKLEKSLVFTCTSNDKVLDKYTVTFLFEA